MPERDEQRPRLVPAARARAETAKPGRTIGATKILRWWGIAALCLLCWACDSRPSVAPSTAPSATPPAAPTPSTTAASQATSGSKGTCVPLLDAHGKTARIFGIGSHAHSKTDVTIDLTTGKMTGTTFEIAGSEVTPVTVDDTLLPDELSRLRKVLEATCIETQDPPDDPQGVPGGYSYLEIVGSKQTVWVMFGTPNEKMPAGARFASVSREEWKRITAAYPKTRPSERGAASSE